MKEKEITIGEKTYKVRELKYVDAIDLQDKSKGEMAKALLKLSAGLTEEEINELSMNEGLELQNEVNKFNGFNKDFQNPTIEKAN